MHPIEVVAHRKRALFRGKILVDADTEFLHDVISRRCVLQFTGRERAITDDRLAVEFAQVVLVEQIEDSLLAAGMSRTPLDPRSISRLSCHIVR